MAGGNTGIGGASIEEVVIVVVKRKGVTRGPVTPLLREVRARTYWHPG